MENTHSILRWKWSRIKEITFFLMTSFLSSKREGISKNQSWWIFVQWH